MGGWGREEAIISYRYYSHNSTYVVHLCNHLKMVTKGSHHQKVLLLFGKKSSNGVTPPPPSIFATSQGTF